MFIETMSEYIFTYSEPGSLVGSIGVKVCQSYLPVAELFLPN